MGTSTIPLWGRAYKLTVKYASASGEGQQEIISQSAWEPEALRITFDILETVLPSPYWFADVTVYNLNNPEMQNFLFNAYWLTFEAGFQTGPSKSSIIWDGPVLQVLFDREDVIDFKITFNCVASVPLLDYGFVNFASGRYSSQLQLVSKMISQIGGELNTQVSQTAQNIMSAKTYPRGKTLFGRISKYLWQMADSNFLSNWVAGNQHYISEISTPGSSITPSLIYAPPLPKSYSSSAQGSNITYSILGVPRQTPFGVIFTVLLDPRLVVKVPPLLVQIDNAVISQLKVIPNQTVMTTLDQGQNFVAAQIHHYGDTRGNDWATEVTGYNLTYAQGLLSGTFLPITQPVATGGGS